MHSSVENAVMAVKMMLEPRLEQIFHPSSYGCRPGRGGKMRLGKCAGTAGVMIGYPIIITSMPPAFSVHWR